MRQWKWSGKQLGTLFSSNRRIEFALLCQFGQVNALEFKYDYFMENCGEIDKRVLSERPLFDIAVPCSSYRGIRRLHRLTFHSLSRQPLGAAFAELPQSVQLAVAKAFFPWPSTCNPE